MNRSLAPKSHSWKCGHSYDRPYLCIPCNGPQKRLLIYTISSKGPGISLRSPCQGKHIQLGRLKSIITRVLTSFVGFPLWPITPNACDLTFRAIYFFYLYISVLDHGGVSCISTSISFRNVEKKQRRTVFERRKRKARLFVIRKLAFVSGILDVDKFWKSHEETKSTFLEEYENPSFF